MTTAGFYERKRINPRAMAVVVLLHGAALTALIMAKGEVFHDPFHNPKVFYVPDETPPPPKQVDPPPHSQVPPESHMTVVRPIFEQPPQPRFQTVEFPPPPPGPAAGTAQETVIEPPPPPPPPPPPAPRIEPAHARANLASYVSNDDYPASAIRGEEQGTTRFRLTVGSDGRVTGCTVTASSGSSALDAATCRIMRSRARFTPAHDSSGSPVVDTVSNAIRWVLPDG